MMQHIHHMRAADAGRVIEASIGEAARLELVDALAGPRGHVRLRAEHDGPGRARFDAGRLETDGDAVRAERALVGLVIDRIDAGDIERTTLHAIAAADAVLADEVDDAVGVLDDRAGRRASLEAARILAMHAAVLADQPLQIALLVFPFGEAHQGPDGRVQVRGILVGALEMTRPPAADCSTPCTPPGTPCSRCNGRRRSASRLPVRGREQTAASSSSPNA